jgi:hypothetical protein
MRSAPDPPGEATRDETIAEVVLSRVRRASVGALGTCEDIHWSWVKENGRGTNRLCSGIGRLDYTVVDSGPYIIKGEGGVCPRNGEERAIPSDHWRGFLETSYQVVQSADS